MSGFIVLFYSAKLIWSFVGRVAYSSQLVINKAKSLLLQKEKEFWKLCTVSTDLLLVVIWFFFLFENKSFSYIPPIKSLSSDFWYILTVTLVSTYLVDLKMFNNP